MEKKLEEALETLLEIRQADHMGIGMGVIKRAQLRIMGRL